jgi:hypothetical protein
MITVVMCVITLYLIRFKSLFQIDSPQARSRISGSIHYTFSVFLNRDLFLSEGYAASVVA